MSGADFFVRTLSVLNQQEQAQEQLAFRKQQHQDNFALQNRRIDESTRQFDSQMEERRISRATRDINTSRSLDLRERQLDLAEKAATRAADAETNAKAAETAYKGAQRAILDEQQDREAFEENKRAQFAEFGRHLQSGRPVDVSAAMFGENVDPELINLSRGNSGRGSGVFVQLAEDGNGFNVLTQDPETGEFMPFTVNPEDNESPSAYIPKEHIFGVIHSVASTRNEIEQVDQDGSLMSRFIANNGNLVIGEDGKVLPRAEYELIEEARAEYEKQNPQQETTSEDTTETGLMGKASEFLASEKGTRLVDALKFAAPTGRGSGITDWIGEVVFGAEEQAPEAPIVEEKKTRQAFEDFLKENYPQLGSSNLRYLSKLRAGSPSALEATRGQREKAADMLIEAGAKIEPERLNAYIKNGVWNTEAELMQAGLKSRMDIAKLSKAEAEARKAEAEASGQMSFDEQFDLIDKTIAPWIESTVVASGQFDVRDKNYNKLVDEAVAQQKTALVQFLQSTNTPLSQFASIGGLNLINGASSAYAHLQPAFAEYGLVNASYGPAMALQVSGAYDITDPESAKRGVADLVQLQQKYDMHIDELSMMLIQAGLEQ